jgi:hypothetical protein
MTKNLLTLFIVITIFSACKKDTTDFGKFDGYEASPEIGIPLFNRNLTMLNITESDSANFKTGNDGLISYVFKQDSIYDYGVDNFFSIKSEKSTFEKSLGAISIGDFISSTKSTLIESGKSFLIVIITSTFSSAYVYIVTIRLVVAFVVAT